MKLTDHVHLVASGRLGLGISDDFDGNLYAIDGGSEVALVDAGAGYRAGAAARVLREAGIHADRVGAILLTHKHADHSGGANELAELTGARVLAASATVEAIADGERFDRGLERARLAGLYPEDYRFRAVEAETVEPGTRITVGELTVTVVDTPGHCDGHLAFQLDDGEQVAVFTGDALLPGGEIVVQPIPDFDLALSIETVKRLELLRFDQFFPGHGAPALSSGYRHASLARFMADTAGSPAAFRVPPFAELDASARPAEDAR